MVSIRLSVISQYYGRYPLDMELLAPVPELVKQPA